MTVNTKHVTGRRTLNYATLDDLLRDAEQLAESEVEMLGNWSLGQIFSHVAMTMNNSFDGFPFSAPWIFRVIVQLFMKSRFLTKTVPAGFQIPSKAAIMIPGETSTEEGLTMLRSAIVRLKQESQRMPHPFMGDLSVDEWNQLHLKHTEMHMSFAVPRNEP